MSQTQAKLAVFTDIAAIPEGVELCQHDKCRIAGLHAAHTVTNKGSTSKTYTCKRCKGTVKRGCLCDCRKGTAT